MLVKIFARKLSNVNSLLAKSSIRLSLFGREVEYDRHEFRDGKCIIYGCEPVGPKPGKRLGISRPPEEE